jgi:hypothetical protein
MKKTKSAMKKKSTIMGIFLTICGRITASIAFDCANPPSGGANDRLILMNFDDWGDCTIGYNVSNTLIIESIAPASGAVAYSFEGHNNSVEPRSALVKGKYVDGYDHEVRFKIFNNSPDIKAQLNKLGNSKVVAIIQNNHKGDDGDAAFEVYGSETGLNLQELERIIADAELQGAYNLLIRNDEVSRPGTLPQTIFNTDFATSKAIVDGLL